MRLIEPYFPLSQEWRGVMIDATHLKAHHTATSLLKKGLYPDISDAAVAG